MFDHLYGTRAMTILLRIVYGVSYGCPLVYALAQVLHLKRRGLRLPIVKGCTRTYWTGLWQRRPLDTFECKVMEAAQEWRLNQVMVGLRFLAHALLLPSVYFCISTFESDGLWSSEGPAWKTLHMHLSYSGLRLPWWNFIAVTASAFPNLVTRRSVRVFFVIEGARIGSEFLLVDSWASLSLQYTPLAFLRLVLAMIVPFGWLSCTVCCSITAIVVLRFESFGSGDRTAFSEDYPEFDMHFIGIELIMLCLTLMLSWFVNQRVLGQFRLSFSNWTASQAEHNVLKLLFSFCDAVVSLDADFCISTPSPQLAAILLRAGRPNALLGKSLFDFMSDEDEQLLKSFLNLAVQSNCTQCAHIFFKDTNALPVKAELFCTSVQGLDGQLGYLIGVRDLGYQEDCDTFRESQSRETIMEVLSKSSWSSSSGNLSSDETVKDQEVSVVVDVLDPQLPIVTASPAWQLLTGSCQPCGTKVSEYVVEHGDLLLWLQDQSNFYMNGRTPPERTVFGATLRTPCLPPGRQVFATCVPRLCKPAELRAADEAGRDAVAWSPQAGSAGSTSSDSLSSELDTFPMALDFCGLARSRISKKHPSAGVHSLPMASEPGSQARPDDAANVAHFPTSGTVDTATL